MVLKRSIFFILMCFVFLPAASVQGKITDMVKKLNWHGIEVIWIQDETLPKFDIAVYFADGALSDHSLRAGETDMMFELLGSGTTRYNQAQIADSLDFYGSQMSASVNHEYSVLQVSGLTKHMLPTVKMVCHLLDDATYPSKEIVSYRNRLSNQINNMVTNHGALADRAFRKMALKKTPFALPSEGELATIKNIGQRSLAKKKDYFNTKVFKRIYVTGPSSIKQLEHVFKNDCHWEKSGDFHRADAVSYQLKSSAGPRLYFLEVPEANQAQIRMGKLLGEQTLNSPSELMTLTSSFLGGGFTSRLIQELRVNRGLTYSAFAKGNNQKSYGRSVISTFTKNETLKETLEVIKEMLSKYAAGEIIADELKLTRNYLAGSYLFSYEASKALMGKLLFFDHIGKDYNDLYHFPGLVKKNYPIANVTEMFSLLFSWHDLTIVVVGDKSLKADLAKFGKPKVIGLNEIL